MADDVTEQLSAPIPILREMIELESGVIARKLLNRFQTLKSILFRYVACTDSQKTNPHFYHATVVQL